MGSITRMAEGRKEGRTQNERSIGSDREQRHRNR